MEKTRVSVHDNISTDKVETHVVAENDWHFSYHCYPRLYMANMSMIRDRIFL